MPFESLSEKIQYSLRKLTGRGKVNEKDIDDAMREIRVSLLEADVNYKIVKQFISEVKEKALGERVMKSLTPGDQVVKIVYEELVKLMGEEAVPLNLKKSGISVILVVGLQGSGKTTHVGKLANYLRKNYKLKPLMVAADVYRPAAINQLVTIGKQLDIEVFEMGILTKPQVIAKKGLEYAKEKGYNVVLIDTAGRLAIDEALMQELVEIKDIVNPDEILLTVDAMTGQDAVNVATKFHEKLDVTGCLLTKLDSDTRGGAALSIRYMTQIPIKFTGIGEKMDEIDEATDRVLMGPAKTSRKISDKEKRLVAIHESGHAVIGIKLPDAQEVHKITIIPRGMAGGYTMMLPKEEKMGIMTKEELESQIIGLMGGRAAERLFLNATTTGASDDFKKATRIARSMVTKYGMSDLGPMQLEEEQEGVFLGRDYNKTKNFSDQVALEIDKAVRKIVDDCYDKAVEILKKNEKLVHLLADALVENETLTKEQIECLVETGKMCPADPKQTSEPTMVKLKEIAKSKNIKGYAKMTREELEAALKENDK